MHKFTVWVCQNVCMYDATSWQKKIVFISSAVSSPLDRSKRFTLFALPDRPVHSDANSASPGSILARQQLRAKTKSLTFPPLYTALILSLYFCMIESRNNSMLMNILAFFYRIRKTTIVNLELHALPDVDDRFRYVAEPRLSQLGDSLVATQLVDVEISSRRFFIFAVCQDREHSKSTTKSRYSANLSFVLEYGCIQKFKNIFWGK